MAQVGGQIARRGVTPPRLLCQRLQADRLQIARNAIVELAQALRLVVENLVQQHPEVAAEGELAGEQFVEDDTEAVHVAAAVDLARLTGRLLRAHVRRCAYDRPILSDPNVSGVALGEAEVHQARPANAVQHHIGRLDVTVDDAALMGVIERFGKSGRDLAALAEGQPTGRHAVAERDAFYQFAGHERLAVHPPGIEESNDMWMLQTGDIHGLTQEAVDFGGIVVEVARQLEGNEAIQLRVAGTIDAAKSAAAEQPEQLILADAPRVGEPLLRTIADHVPGGAAQRTGEFAAVGATSVSDVLQTVWTAGDHASPHRGRNCQPFGPRPNHRNTFRRDSGAPSCCVHFAAMTCTAPRQPAVRGRTATSSSAACIRTVSSPPDG